MSMEASSVSSAARTDSAPCSLFQGVRDGAGFSDGFRNLLRELYEVLLRIARRHSVWVIGFSGGKDSTLLLHLVTEYLCAAARRGDPTPKRVVTVYNDTLVELPPVHEWAVEVLDAWRVFMRRNLSAYGISARYVVTRPRITDTFYWRLFVRGYPAPNFKFRWCTELFKIQPARRFLEQLARDELGPGETAALLVGSRDDESAARKRSNTARAIAACPVGGCFESFLLSTDYPRARKYAVLRFWREGQVWSFLAQYEPPWRLEGGPGYDRLFALYGRLPSGLLVRELPSSGSRRRNSKPRHGCWMCTVSKYHLGFQMLKTVFNDEYEGSLELLWILRRIYRIVTDDPGLRMEKRSGRLGPLTADARGLLHSLMGVVAETRYGKRLLYGLFDEFRISPKEKRSTYYFFYELASRDPAEAFRRINELEARYALRRRILGVTVFTVAELEKWVSGTPEEHLADVLKAMHVDKLKKELSESVNELLVSAEKLA